MMVKSKSKKETSMNVYERIQQLCKEKGVSVRQMEIDNNMAKGHAYKWNTRTPSAENLLKLSEYFGVSTDYILTGGAEGISKEKLYTDKEVIELAKEIIELVNEVIRIPEAKVFLSAIKDMPKEDLEIITSLAKKMAGNR